MGYARPLCGLNIMDSDSKPSFIERLTSLLLREPEDREQLLEVLHSALTSAT